MSQKTRWGRYAATRGLDPAGHVTSHLYNPLSLNIYILPLHQPVVLACWNALGRGSAVAEYCVVQSMGKHTTQKGKQKRENTKWKKKTKTRKKRRKLGS